MPDFTTVTEITGNKVTREQIERMYTRYRFAAELCENKDVLEVACGSGQGLGLLAKKAKRVLAGDIEEENLKLALRHYKDRPDIELKVMDAQQLALDNESFDVIILYEAIYYLAHPERFVQEAKRVLRKGGILLICIANKDCPSFNPSPYSHRYFSVPELFGLMKEKGFDNITIFGSCPDENKNLKDKFISLLKRSAVRLHLIPRTMKGKECLKRIFMGKLEPLPSEILESAYIYQPPIALPVHAPNAEYKVLFAKGHK